MKQIVCPNCFARNTPDQIQYVCSHTGCEKMGVPVPSGSLVPENGKMYCPACKRALTERICPECGYPVLLEDDDSVPGVPVSIVGAEGSGKSNYLSVMIDQLRRKAAKTYNFALYPQGGDETIHQYENRYYRPLFVKKQCISSTQQEEVTPLLYSLVFSAPNPTGRSCNLTFYDACGANFKSEKVMADYNRSVYNAKGIIFFIDPSQIPGIRDQIPVSGRPVSDDDADTLLSRTIHLIRQSGGARNIRKKIDIPIAVCLTKLDVIKKVLDPSSFLLYTSRHVTKPRFDLADFRSTGMEVQSLLESWNSVEIVNQVTSQFSEYGFFGLSSLGNPPDDANNIQQLSPHRVLDPILWILWKNNIIHAGGQDAPNR